MAAVVEILTWRDAKGNTARTKFYVNGTTLTADDTAARAVFNAMTPISNAHLQAAVGAATISPTEVIYGTNADFPSIEDKAVFTFQTAAGAIHRLSVPAPISSIFLADGETVDQTNTAVVTFTSAVVANCVSQGDQAIAFGGFGIRKRVKNRRKLNMFIKDPTLTGPAE